MINLTYIRSSFLGTQKLCPQKLFLSQILGLKEKANRKANLGTICHKVLETIALCHYKFQDNNKSKINFKDDKTGFKLKIDRNDFYKPSTVSNIEVDVINGSRVNKSVYKHSSCFMQYDTIRYGEEIVDYLIEYYTKYYIDNDTDNIYQPIERKHVKNWTHMTLEYMSRIADPRTKYIVEPELKFDIELPYDWAHYNFDFDGDHFEGQLHLKGTIDLVFKEKKEDKQVCFLDYKFGEKKNWLTNEAKTYDSLQNEDQLLFYSYVISKIYKQEETIGSIFFVRSGGLYSFVFDSSKMIQLEKIIQDTITELKNTTVPKMLDPHQKHFMCNRVCSFYKKGNICKEINNNLKIYDMDTIIKKYKNKNFDISHYQSPGSI